MNELKENFQAGNILEMGRLAKDDVTSQALLEVWAYWNAARGGRFAPALKAFRLDELSPRIVPYMAVIDFIGSEPDFLYRLFGTRMVDIVGREMTGKRLIADGVRQYGAVNAEIFPTVIAEKGPVWTRSKWKSERGLVFDTITVRLPLSENGTDVTGGVMALQFTDRLGEDSSKDMVARDSGGAGQAMGPPASFHAPMPPPRWLTPVKPASFNAFRASAERSP